MRLGGYIFLGLAFIFSISAVKVLVKAFQEQDKPDDFVGYVVGVCFAPIVFLILGLSMRRKK